MSIRLQTLLYRPPSAANSTVSGPLHRFAQCICTTVAHDERHAGGLPLWNDSNIDPRARGHLHGPLYHYIGVNFQRRRHHFIQSECYTNYVTLLYRPFILCCKKTEVTKKKIKNWEESTTKSKRTSLFVETKSIDDGIMIMRSNWWMNVNIYWCIYTHWVYLLLF